MTYPMRALLGLLACALLLAGCGTDPYEGLPSKGTLHMSVLSEIKGFDPTQADEETSNTCVYNVYDQLYEYHYLKRPFELVPAVAATLPEVSPDGLTYTIRLKPGIRYQDDPCFTATGGKGREVKASDLVFAFQRVMDFHVNSPGTSYVQGYIEGLDAFHDASKQVPADPHRSSYTPADGFPPVDGLSSPDDRTLVVRLSTRFPEFVWVLAMPYLSVYPPEAVARYGAAFRVHPVSTGPYLLESFKPGQRAVFVRNPGYRDDRYPSEGNPGDQELGRLRLAGERLPVNERVVITVMKESQPRWLYFDGGQLDWVGIPIDTFFMAVDPATKDLRTALRDRGVVLERDARVEIAHDLFNMRDPVIGAPAGERGRALRRAMSLAFDREWTSKHLYNGQTRRVEGPILEDFPEFDPSFVNPWVRGKSETIEQARERAQKVLADAGMPGGAGVPVIQAEVSDSTTDEHIFQAFQRDLAAIGLQVTPYKVTWTEQVTRQREAKYQISGLVWGADYPAAQNFLQLFYGPNRAPGVNSANYENAEFDRLYAEALGLPPGPERNALYHRMQRMVTEDVPWIFRYRREQWSVRQGWLEGFRYNDISLKWFKYRRADDARRASAHAEWTKVVLWPPVVAALAVGLVVVYTLRAGRRQVKGW